MSTRRSPRPIDRQRLQDLAIAYMARYAASSGQLTRYLTRKLRENGWAEDGAEPDVAELVDRFIARGWIDDAEWGQSRAQGLLARGYGGHRIDASLRAAGLDETLRRSLAPEEWQRREAAVAQARRRRIGPFGAALPGDPQARDKARQKQLAAMLRAGHDFAAASRVIGAGSVEELEEWVEESRGDAADCGAR